MRVVGLRSRRDCAVVVQSCGRLLVRPVYSSDFSCEVPWEDINLCARFNINSHFVQYDDTSPVSTTTTVN